jgi:histidinol-phosphatase (PHP family)
MIADCHIHTEFSDDSDAAPEAMAEKAAFLGMKAICFTDHYDMDFPLGGFELRTEEYCRALAGLKREYEGRLEIRTGVELGLQPELQEKIPEYLRRYAFDYVIGSIHLVKGKDPYYRQELDMSDREMYREYFRFTLENLQKNTGFHSLGHLDYVARYGYDHGKACTYQEHAELLDEILKLLVRRDIALELNTGGMRKGLPHPNPHPDILRRYRELGGEMVTLGSDAHRPSDIGSGFAEAVRILKENGFGSVTEFRQGRPVEVPITSDGAL